MRRDITFGLLISVGVHLGAIWYSQIGKGGPPRPPTKPEALAYTSLTMPPIEPEPPEIVENQEAPAPAVDLAPPTLNDVPQLATDAAFVQQIQPPPPEGTRISANAFLIPPGHAGDLRDSLQVFDPAKLDKQPIARYQAKPQYPFEMRRQGICGEVVVDFIVDSGGEVRNACAAGSSRHEFETAAIQAVTKWKFSPGRKGGRAVFTHMQVPILFTLTENN